MSNPHRGAAASVTSTIVNAVAALGAAALMAGAVGANASDLASTRTTYISLYGYCDVLQLAVFSWQQAGEADTCGGASIAVGSGMEGKVTGVYPKDLTIGETYFSDTSASYLFNIQFPLASGQTWSIYRTADGVNFSYVNSGTYTIVNAEAAQSPQAGPTAHSAAQ